MCSRTRILPALLALVVAAFVAFYPQLDAMGYCDQGGCPDISQSAHSTGHASGGGASPSGSGAVHGVDAHGAGLTGIGLAALVGAPAYLLAPAFLLLKVPPGPPRPGSLLLSPDSPPPRPYV